MNSADSQAVLITGVSTGIGLGMTETLLSKGHRVFGSVRSPELAQKLEGRLGENFTSLVFDLSSGSQIERAKMRVESALAGSPLNAIINSAGMAELGPLLHVDPECLTRHLDVLVTGQLRVIQAFVPLMTGDSVGRRIYNISSISGKWPNTFFGCYAAAKHALEGLSKTLRIELKRDGIQVVVVAPGNIATDIWSRQNMEAADRYKHTDYYRPLKARVQAIQNTMASEAMTIDEFSQLFYSIFTNPNPADRYTVMKCHKWRYPFSLLTKFQARAFPD